MNRRRNKTRILFMIIAAVIIAALLMMLPSSLDKVRDRAAERTASEQSDSKDSSGSGSDTEQESGSDTEQGSGTENGDPGSADNEPLSVIFCASDYQAEEGWESPADNLSGILDAAIAGTDASSGIGSFIMCGDYSNDRKLHDYQVSPDGSISEIKGILHEKLPVLSDDDMIFVQGNHDAMTDSISESGLHEFDDYLVYVLNTQEDFPWKQGKTSGALSKVTASSEALGTCLGELADKGEKRPVIIAGHVPLHFTARTSGNHTTGDNLYSSLIFDTVNEAAGTLDIIYIYGHNHSKGWDCYMGGSAVFRKAGDTLLIPEYGSTDTSTDTYSRKVLDFTYLNAGYTGYYMNCGPEEVDNGTWKDYEAADGTLTGTVISIYDDRIELSRWDRDGMHALSGAGEADPYKGGIDSDLIPASMYGERVESPQIIQRRK